MSAEELGGLCVGDYITLNSGIFGAYLGAEGIIKPDVTANVDAEFDDNIFQVHLQRQYSAARELDAFKVNYKIEETLLSGAKLDEATKQYLQALETGCNNEVALNNVYLENRSGEPVVFGAVVQLYHVKSKKYICVDPKQLATYERENSLVYLDVAGNANSWFKLFPRYKIDREGERIMSGSEVYIGLVERKNEFLHIAEAAPRATYQREVNNSLISTSFKLEIFQSNVVSKDKTLTLLSDLVCLFDPETRSHVAIGIKPLESLDEPGQGAGANDEGSVSKGGEREEGEGKGEDDVGSAAEEGGSDQGEGEGEEEGGQFFHQHGDIVLDPVTDSLVADSRTLWKIEGGDLSRGGPIQWRSVKIRFRHVASGLYMQMVSRRPEEQLTASNAVLTTTARATDEGTLFSFFEPNGGKFLRNAKALLVNHNGIWLERGAHNDLMYEVKCARNRSSALSVVINPFSTQPKIPRDDAALAPLDEHVAMSGREYLRRFLNMTVIPRGNTTATLWPTAIRTDMPFFLRIMESLVYFSQGFPISREKVVLGAESSDPVLRTQRQRLLREVNNIEYVLRLINRLIPISVKAESLATKRAKLTEEERSLVRMGSAILDRCFHFIYYSVLDNPENQIYVADFIKVLLAHLSTQVLAGKCVTEMLSKNMELQETKIGQEEIGIFVAKLRTSNMNSMYLQLLQSCCSCEGQGVDNNQCLVADLLFEDTNDIIIEVLVDYSKSRVVEWDRESIYIPKEPVPGSPLLGDVLLTKGLPALALSWTTNSIDCSPLGLFGKLSVNVLDLYGTATKASSHTKKAALEDPTKEKSANTLKLEEKKAASQAQKLAVADYFINEMFLGAEMCMDRNYVAMHKLDPYFSYETLVTILRLDVSDKLKAGAARLLLCLHIDRDPQAETKIPCLTRLWTETARSAAPPLPFVEPGRKYVYGLVQQIVSEHVKSMAGTHWEPYSKYVLDLQLAMLKFNFYGTIERMNDVIEPMVSACDRRKIVYGPVKKAKAPPVEGEEAGLGLGEQEDPSKQEGEGTGESSGEGDENQIPWQKTVFDFFESLPVMCAVLLLVLVAVCVTIYQASDPEADDSPGTPLFAWGIFVLCCFLIDYCSRLYCFIWIYGKPLTFLFEPFNVIDFVVISLDVIFLSLPPGLTGNDSSLTRILRLVRLVRLLRVVRAVKVVHQIHAALQDNENEAWTPPERYLKVPLSEAHTLVKAQKILYFVQSVVEDRNLSLLLRGFYTWCDEDPALAHTPSQIFEQVIEESADFTLGVGDFDLIFIDMLMISNADLVQGSLDVLMAHHSARQKLLENALNLQLLVSPKRERQFRIIDQMLKQVEQNAETHELWGELKSETDHLTNKQTKELLAELTDIVRVRRTVLEFDEEFRADKEIQDLFRNLGCFTICFKMLGLEESIGEEDEETGELDEISANTRELCLLTNELLYWFYLGNPENQVLGYSELEFYIDSLESKINSHRCIKAIFKNNENLMRLVPHSNISNAADYVTKNGKFHGYLSLPLSITHVGDKNIIKNQFEIVKTFSAPGKLQAVSCFICNPSDPEYKEKLDHMAEVGDGYVEFDNLPEKLAYHFAFLEMLSNCTVGRINVASVEAKVQNVFAYEDCLDCLMDPRNTVLAKTRLAMHFFNAVVEVELSVPGLEKDMKVWRLIKTFPDTISALSDDVKLIERSGWTNNGIVRQRIEYGLTCVKIVAGFFGRYYDNHGLEADEKEAGKVMTQNEAAELVVALWKVTLALYDMRSRVLAEAHRVVLFEALEALNRAATVHFVLEVDRRLVLDFEGVEEEPPTKEEALEVEILAKWRAFLEALQGDEELLQENASESNAFISYLEELPYIAADVDSDLRYEPLIQRLVKHILDSMTLVNGEKRINVRNTKTAVWIVKAFRTMIENMMGMSIYERDEGGGEEEDQAAEDVVYALNNYGATTLCLELIATGIDDTLQLEAIKLLVGMLFREGGARDVQGMVHDYLTSHKSELFFRQVRTTINKLIQWHKWQGVIALEEGQEPEPPEDILIIRFLQLLSEGHYLPNQDLVREQPSNLVQTILLDDFVLYLNALSRLQCRTSTNCAIRVASTILEVIQGPCVGNQSHFALNTDLLEVMNRILRLKDINDCIPEEELELKKTIVDIYEALFEGQQVGSVVANRIISVVHLDIIQQIAKGPILSPGKEPAEGSLELQTECMVMLQILSDFKPSIRAEAQQLMSESGINTQSVEISWDGVLNRRFYPVPDVVNLLAKSSKDLLVADIDRSNSENKIIDFLARARRLYREVKHQEYLSNLGVAALFSTENKDSATWITFVLAWLQNSLFMAYLNVRKDQNCTTLDQYQPHCNPNPTPSMPDEIDSLALGLNIVQIVFAFYAVLLTLVVRSPVVAQTLQANNEDWGPLRVAFYTALDPSTLYYFAYLIGAILGSATQCFWIALLLLDIVVKNDTAANVLRAVSVPFAAGQLPASLLLGFFLFYIFAFYFFIHFQYSTPPFGMVGNGEMGNQLCNSLWNCTKYMINFGLQLGGGPADMLDATIGVRLWFDFFFFLIMSVIWVNVTFGIIIDTFSALRGDKEARLKDTTEFCFICGLDRQTFDRSSDVPDGFKIHIRNDHNMWSYLGFIFFIWEQDKDDDDGLEYYVRHKIDGNEITWFPLNKAMRLPASDSRTEEMQKKLAASVEAAQAGITSRLGDLQSDVGLMLENLTDVLRDVQQYAEETEQGEQEEQEWFPALGYDISLGVVEVSGAEQPEEELRLLNLRVIADSGMYSCNTTGVDMARKAALFDGGALFLVGENAQPSDKNPSLSIQILQGTGAGASKFIGVVELSLGELLQQEQECTIDRPFQRMGQVADCVITLKLEWEEARTFASSD